MVYCGVIHHPQQRLIQILCYCEHQQTSQLACSVYDRKLKCKIGGAIGNHTRKVEAVGVEGVLVSGGGAEG